MRNAEVIRQWQILREIEAKRVGVTIHDLAGLTSVSTRTIRRDLQALQEAGFAIYDEGGEQDTKRWKLETQPFQSVQEGLSVSDVAALYLSRSMVEAMSGWPLADELRTAFEKIEGGLNPRMREFLSTLPQVLSTKGGPKQGAASDRLVDLTRRLLDAVRSRRVVSMRYFSAASNRSKSYEVHPYRLALAHGGLYLIAWVPHYDEFRTFATERIEKLSVSEDVFRKTRDLPADLFGASLGVFSGEAETIVLEFDAKMSLYVRGRVWHESQQLEELPTGGVRLTLQVSNDWALRSWVLGFGATVTVREPAALADAIADECRQTAERYT